MDTIYAFVDVVFRSRFTGALVWLADPSRTRRDGKGSIISINPVFRMNFNIVGLSLVSCPDYFSPSGREECGLGTRLCYLCISQSERWYYNLCTLIAHELCLATQHCFCQMAGIQPGIHARAELFISHFSLLTAHSISSAESEPS